MKNIVRTLRAEQGWSQAVLGDKAAAASANWSGSGEEIVLTDKPGANTWPIAGATFILMYKQQSNPALAREILSFFDWAYRKGSYFAELIDYVSLSSDVTEGIRRKWAENLHASDGEAIWPGLPIASRTQPAKAVASRP